jgi:PAS domain-containing protein
MDTTRDDGHAVVVHDTAGTVLSRNARAAELLGVQPGDTLPGHESQAPVDVRSRDGAWRRLRPQLEEVYSPDQTTVLAVVRSYDEEALILLPDAELDLATREERAAPGGRTPAAPPQSPC